MSRRFLEVDKNFVFVAFNGREMVQALGDSQELGDHSGFGFLHNSD
jgi:hypothetical protein